MSANDRYGMTAEARMMHSKAEPAWKKTIYIVGLPRSGKSTIYNVLASCKHVEALEEPFDLLSVAQKASQYAPETEIYEDYRDLYRALMENNFSELVLGRTYNFRKQDKSCIFNYKPAAHVELAHSRDRRLDVLAYAQSVDASFVVAFNDIERSIEFVGAAAPQAQFVHVKRNIVDVAREIAGKMWLSDEQLSTQANMAPAYGAVVQWSGRTIYLPYWIPLRHAELFLSLGGEERAIMYACLQDRALSIALAKMKYPCQSLMLEEIVKDPQVAMRGLIQNLGLVKSEMTDRNIEVMKGINANEGQRTLKDLDLSTELKVFLERDLEYNT